MKHILVVDGLNLIHRARVAMRDAEHGCTFAALRSIRSLVERFKPDITYFVLEELVHEQVRVHGPRLGDVAMVFFNDVSRQIFSSLSV